MDLDDLWAIADCYGISIAEQQRHLVCLDALPRLQELFERHRLRATLFVVGKDLESAEYVAAIRRMVAQGHEVANHSWSHRLDFRDATPGELEAEVIQCHETLERTVGRAPVGFRAPGYGYSDALAQVLSEHKYAYDSSLMPGPYGGVFRWMDQRLQRRGGASSGRKTQYSQLSDAAKPLLPHRRLGSSLIELPAATSPLLRLPFQAGVCMRLGRRYFEANLKAFARKPELPLLFLVHAADVADFSRVARPFFKSVAYFATAVDQKMEMLDYFLGRIAAVRRVLTTEEWLRSGEAEQFIRAS